MEKRFVIWGRNPIIEALKAGKSLEKILFAHDSHLPKELIKLAEKHKVKVQKVPRKKVEEIAGTKKTQGVVALVSPIQYADENSLIEETVKKNGVLLIMDHITDPQNVGNMIRTAEVFGVDGIVIPRERSSPINEVVVKASTGAVFHIPITKVGSLRQFLEKFKKKGGWVVAVEKGGKHIHKLEFPFPLAVVLGSEGKGVSKSVLDSADLIATIPMKGKITSLNVSSATAIALWEVAKQKWIEN
ncbi:23S rRNA (guanosine(2251)-2'-O)-methyltransferase RlmB [Persephonella atlantica]|uniref:23S rRNA (Guanosine(2251)-2'-O)-methyltransferase RlmB n=1 Tax=Persephonella atlantica TaxID=2699429 RepID=A0ABS1GGR2_9AQUI|nr:23S rRNA (guanosine(2251)-2'-O)-methyltransferase RlmB [Persephonella atlantica]MBK3332116.1 23S rRNA (guanosine(2251)-2'-O)-methyltransferase RlmB [Persephonella atlantica]